MNEKIKILHVVGRMDRGGTEALLMNLLHTIDKDKYQFDFVEQTMDQCDYDVEIESLGSRIYRCPHISVKNLSKYRKWWKNFYKEHPEYKIIHGHSRGSAPIYLDEAKKAGRITILHCHSNSHGKGVKGFIRYMWQLPLRELADYNFACSYNAGISQFGKHSKFSVINNGVRTEKYVENYDVRESIRSEMGIEDKFVVGNVGRFEEPKNHKFLVEIFYELQKRRANACLMLVGQGSLEQQIRLRIKELGIQDKVIFTGVRSDVHELLQAMDIFVFPSLYEGLPLALVEAQASGLPCFVSADVISSDVDLTELIHHISLEYGSEHWVDIILNSNLNRKNMVEQIKKAGFDIQSTSNILCDFYERVS